MIPCCKLFCNCARLAAPQSNQVHDIMEIHLNEAEILRILLSYANSVTSEEFSFDAAEISRYPTFKVILKASDEAQ